MAQPKTNGLDVTREADTLRAVAKSIADLEADLRAARELRKRLVQSAVRRGLSYRTVAELAGCSAPAVQAMVHGPVGSYGSGQ